MPLLLGTSPNQVPTVGDLGNLAFKDVTTVPVPASAIATGNVGDIAQDGSYLYVCTAANTWKRVAISTW